MTPSFSRGVRDASRLALQHARHYGTRDQRSAVLLDPTFRYHVPRRILSRALSSQNLKTARTSHTTNTKPEQSRSLCDKSRYNSFLSLSDGRQTDIGHSTESRDTPISLYLNALQGQECGRTAFKPKTSNILSQVARRAFHTTRQVSDQVKKDEKSFVETARNESSKNAPATPPPPPGKSYQEHFYERLHMPQFHRPTKEELLAAATGFWSRLKVRFKWATIRSVRPYNMDEIFGLFSWIFFGHILWLIIGTTTFVSLAILAINTVFAQETLAGWVGNYLTYSSGLKVVFESAVVPKWSGGVITFRNVFVSRRPGKNKKSSVKKGSPEAAALAAAEDQISEEDQNYTQFDVNLGEVNVTLSFNKWWNSKGLLQNVEIKHVRGVVDRTHVHWTGPQLDPKEYRYQHTPGDFEIENFKIEDLLLTIHQPRNFRPFTVSIYNADLPRLRKHWLFYDFLCANNMTGELDHSLFTVHQRQTHSFTGASLTDTEDISNEPWKRQSRIRVDALNIDHLNRGVTGPFSWIQEGNVDVVADIMIPNDTDDSMIKVMSDLYDRMEATLTSRKHIEPYQHQTPSSEDEASATTPTPTPSSSAAAEMSSPNNPSRFLIMDLRIHLNDVRASVPIFTRDLSYINNALIRPIVAYINSRRTFIPINCRVVKRASDFDGSWTVFDSGLMDDLSAEVYDAFARDVTDEQARMRRLKKVGLWGVQLAVQAIFLVSSLSIVLGVVGAVDSESVC